MSQPVFKRFMDVNDTEYSGAQWAYTDTNATTDTFTLKNAAGETLMTVTVVYTDSTKAQWSTITRS